MRKLPDVTSELGTAKSSIRWLVFIGGVIIGGGSIIYTNNLVNQIREREQQQIELYARSLEYLANDDNENPILILDEIIVSNTTVPVILTNADKQPEQYRNLPKADVLTGEVQQQYLSDEVTLMEQEHDPILITLRASGETYGSKYIFYKNSRLLTQLQYYPYIQLSLIGLFSWLIILVFNYFKKSEQNKVWVGLAKETAHQLGTPLSSLMAWSEYFKETQPSIEHSLHELDKDIQRLQVVTERFSNIGSIPQLKDENLTKVVEDMAQYLSTRLSSKINIQVSSFPGRYIHGQINKSLFAWVIENLCKNAADAMEGKGRINIRVMRIKEGIAVDVTDTGKGMSKSKAKQIFQAGFTTKKRGWGLGLTLAKRIIENYHQGKIFVKRSDINSGTTFRIFLKR